MDYVIFTDTSANLPDKVVREYGLRQIPFFYCPPEHPEGIPCPGSEEFDGSAYYNAIRRGAVVTTSQINVHQYVNAMDPVLEAGHDILFVGMSSGISGAYHCATQAAHILSEQYPERRIRTVDTLSASLGEGLLVIEAAKMRDAGVGLDEVADRLNSLRMRMGQIFTVDDLFCLKRGGRLSGAAALLGTALGIKPILCSNAQGQILSCAKVRGRRASIQALADRYDQLVHRHRALRLLSGRADTDHVTQPQSPPARDHDRHVRACNRRTRRSRRAGAVLLRKPCQPGAGKVVNLTGRRQ